MRHDHHNHDHADDDHIVDHDDHHNNDHNYDDDPDYHNYDHPDDYVGASRHRSSGDGSAVLHPSGNSAPDHAGLFDSASVHSIVGTSQRRSIDGPVGAGVGCPSIGRP